MKLLADLFPILLFFIAYKTYDIFVATGVAIAASLVQVIWHFARHKTFQKTHVITFVMLAVFGGLTIFLRDPEFLMWKVSVVNILFALAFLGSSFVGKKTLIERMLGGQLTLPKFVWLRLNNMWAVLFVLISIVNAYFVNLALSARDAFFMAYQLAKDESLNQLVCVKNIAPELCRLAQETESTWVDFKLFGTMGMTFLFIILTGIYLNKYVKND